MLAEGTIVTPTATLNGVPTQTFVRYSVSSTEFQHWYAVLPNPPSGTNTFTLNLNTTNEMDYVVFTVQNADLSSITDVNVFNPYSIVERPKRLLYLNHPSPKPAKTFATKSA
jgi:hypothetical protein